MTVTAVASPAAIRGPLQFGETLKAWRRRRGVTQQQLADLSTVSVRAIRDLEIGRVARPRRDTLRLICDALGLTGRARADFYAAAIRAGDDQSWLDGAAEAAAPPPAVFDDIVGRGAELAALREAIAGRQRLMAVVGLAGAGKTRLVLEAVAGPSGHPGDLPVLWSGFASDPAPAMIRAALSNDGPAITRIGASDQLSALIRDRDALLVCDGYDPDRLDVPAVTALLRACRGLRILVTTRTPLATDGVWSLPLGGLPDDDAARLLLRHARVTGGTDAKDVVTAICRGPPPWPPWPLRSCSTSPRRCSPGSAPTRSVRSPRRRTGPTLNWRSGPPSRGCRRTSGRCWRTARSPSATPDLA